VPVSSGVLIKAIPAGRPVAAADSYDTIIGLPLKVIFVVPSSDSRNPFVTMTD
jgi:hypothetical protein